MEKLNKILNKYNFPAFLLKKNTIIAFNDKYRIICPDIERIKDIRILYNLKDNFIKDSSTVVVSNDFNAYSLNFNKYDKINADFLVFVNKVEETDFLDPNYVFNNLIRLGYLIVDIDDNNELIGLDLPEYFKLKYGITDSYEFIKKHSSEDEVERFKLKVKDFYLQNEYFFDFNTKLTFLNHRLNFQLRCFPKLTSRGKQLFCSVIEYTEIAAINMQMNEAEKRFTQLYENSIDPIIIVDREKVVSFNKAAYRIFKSYDLELTKGLSLNLIFQDELKRNFLFEPDNHLKKINDTFFSPKGDIIFFEYTIIPIKLHKKENFAMIFNDITETHNLFEKIETDKQKYEEILNKVFDGIVLTDNFIIEYWNKSAEIITGYSKEDVFGKDIYSIFDNTFKKGQLENFDDFKIFETDNVDNFKTIRKVRTKNGKEIILNITITNYINNQGKAKALGIFRDITEKYKAEEEIKKQKEELNNVNTALKNFFSILAHDMRTPVIQMMSLSNLLYEDFESFCIEEQKKYLSMLNLASKNGLELLDSVVEWGRTMTNKVVFKPENFDINNVINKIIRLNTTIFSSKGISIKYIAKNYFVSADSNMVFTILNNLLSNAIKFSFKDSKIIINTQLFDDFIQVSLKDFGIGIEDVDKIFYYDKKNISLGTENEKGKGIGLLLTQELVKKNGGKIWVESEIGKGSTFYFTVPKSSKE